MGEKRKGTLLFCGSKNLVPFFSPSLFITYTIICARAMALGLQNRGMNGVYKSRISAPHATASTSSAEATSKPRALGDC